MKTTPVCRMTITLTAVFSLGLALASPGRAETPKKKAKTVPDRLVITDDASAAPQPDPTPLGPARPMTALDSSGTPRAPGEPRMVTGSLIPQKFDLYANDANTAIPLQIFKASDLAAKGKGFGGKYGAVAPNYADSVASAGRGPAPEPTFVRVRTTRTLDLRTVAPGQRLEVATRLLGEERGRKLVSDFNRWEAARKKRLSMRWTGELS